MTPWVLSPFTLQTAVGGTIAVGLFSNGGDGVGRGLFYGGGFAQLGTQLLGLSPLMMYVVVVMFIIFKIIDKNHRACASPR